jgi:hypothetical protein
VSFVNGDGRALKKTSRNERLRRGTGTGNGGGLGASLDEREVGSVGATMTIYEVSLLSFERASGIKVWLV